MKWFGKLIDKLRRSAPAPETALSEHNNTTNIHHMAKKTVITKVLDTNAQDGVIEFAQNRAPSRPKKAAPCTKTLNSTRSKTSRTSSS